MNKKTGFLKYYQVMSLLLVYLFITLSNNFFITASSFILKLNVKGKIENVKQRSLLERTDKATFKESLKNTIAAVPLIVLNFLLPEPPVKTLNTKAYLLKNRSFCYDRYCYLSCCTFRI